jgi:hypothetical protein
VLILAATSDAESYSNPPWLILLVILSAAAILWVGIRVILRDFHARGDDPTAAIVWWILFWPVGVWLWLRERKRSPVTSPN